MVEVLCQVGDNRHCEEQSDEAIHTYFAATWIASRSLPSGAHSRDPLARNDVECCGCLKCEDERIDAAPTRAGSSPRELPLSPDANPSSVALLTVFASRHLLPPGEKGGGPPHLIPNLVSPNSAFCVEGCERQYCGGASTWPPSSAAACQPQRGS